MQAISRWRDYDAHFVRERYNRLAGIFVLFEWLFLLPPGIRRRAVERLELSKGSRVLEVGCGTGRNLELLVGAVGSTGHVYGVDISEGMLSRAEALQARNAAFTGEGGRFRMCNPLACRRFSLSRGSAARRSGAGNRHAPIRAFSLAAMRSRAFCRWTLCASARLVVTIYAPARAFSMKSGRSALLQSGTARTFFSLTRISACSCM